MGPDGAGSPRPACLRDRWRRKLADWRSSPSFRTNACGPSAPLGSRAGGPADGRRKDIDPTAIPSILPCLWIYGYVPPHRFRCRLIGAHVKRLFQPSPLGRFIDESFPPERVSGIFNRFLSMVVRRRATRTIGYCVVSGDRRVPGEHVMLLRSDVGEIASALIGATRYDPADEPTERLFMTESLQTTYIDL